MINTETPPELLTTPEAANILRLKPGTLSKWRWSGDGPTFIKIGAAVRYEPADIQDFIETNRKESTTQSDVAA